MKLLKAFAIAIMLLLVISQAAPAQIYDAVKDFSAQSNPNGVWSYGYLDSWGTPFTLYTWGGNCSGVPGVSWWDTSACSGPQQIAHNDKHKQLCYATWCLPVSYLLLHPGPNGQLSVLRWTAPTAGNFVMRVEFEGLDWSGPTSTYVYVVLNSKRVLLQAAITSYEWPLSFDPKPIRLAAGDTVDLMVDWGKNQNYSFDSTGAELKIWNLGQE